MWSWIQSLLKKEEGQGLTEYALIIALVAVVVTVALTALQGGISGTLNGIVGSLYSRGGHASPVPGGWHGLFSPLPQTTAKMPGIQG